MRLPKRTVLTLSLLFFGFIAFSQESKKIMILELDTLQFYSNAFLLPDLAKINECEEGDVPKLYGALLSFSLENFSYDNYSYLLISEEKKDSVRLENEYRTLTDRTQEEYLGLVPTNREQNALNKLIEENEPDYILSINLYELLTLSDSISLEQDVVHVIHFDLLDKEFKLVHSGRYETETDIYSAYDMDWFYNDFALDLIFWIKTIESGNEDIFGQYQSEIDSYFKKGYSLGGKHGVGVLGGLGMPYGGLGLEYNKVLGDHFEWNAGAGYDFSGFKIGTGVRYYARGIQKAAVNPFGAMRIAWASGNRFTIGGEKDEFGVQLDPDDVSTFRIYSDFALFLEAGLSIHTTDDIVVLPSLFYGFPFSRKSADLISGPDKKGRTNFAKFNAVGGLGIGVTIIGYFN